MLRPLVVIDITLLPSLAFFPEMKKKTAKKKESGFFYPHIEPPNAKGMKHRRKE